MNKNNSTSTGDFTKLTEDFVYGNLALSPISATQAGYHMHQGVALDELDVMGASGIAAQRSTLTGLQAGSRPWIPNRSTKNKRPTWKS